MTDPNKGRTRANLNQGRILANRYQLIELVGQGAMGRVFRAEDTLLGNVTVAVKFLSQALLHPKMRKRFEDEATICALLSEKSIHIVRVRDYGVDEDGIPFYVMEFLEGESLSGLIKAQAIPLTRFMSLVRQICLGLHSAHQGVIYKRERTQIIHRDIKPSNILIVQDPTLGELVKILDFGIAKLIQDDVAQTQSFMGTLAYCSPEQMEGKTLDSRSDIYSLGIMMYEMLTGRMPIIPESNNFGGWYNAHHSQAPHPFEENLKIPKSLIQLILRCLAKSSDSRPQSASEILQILESLEQDVKSTPASASLKLTPKPSESVANSSLPSIEEFCKQTSWPEDKPKKKIVFPHITKTSEGRLISLWVMLDHQDILNHKVSTRYNQFLYLRSPHPMVLWVTTLYNRTYGPRWLPSYLDLKTSQGQRILRSLAQIGQYSILFFDLESPQSCANVMKSSIATEQCQHFLEWANDGHTLPKTNRAAVSKKILKKEYEQRLKPQIELKLEAAYTNYPTDISG